VKPADEKLDEAVVSPFDGMCGQSTLLANEVSPGVPLPGIPTLSPPTVPSPTTSEPFASTTPIGYESDPNIIGKDFASNGSFPWMAALLIDGRSFCGGSLISDQYVLTAAHCTDGAKKITLLLGALNIKAKEDGRVIYNITSESIFQHPDYNRNTITHDITVIKLPERVKFTHNIKPICLPNKYFLSQTYVGEDVRVSGWGKPKDSASGISPALKNTTVSVISNAQCRSFFRSLVTGNLICVGTKFNASPCRGDSGGPLIVKQQDQLGRPFFMQVGIVSFGGNSCQRGFPVGFTRVTAFLDYISRMQGTK
jgi:secreted trypsin-like serine protease